MGKSKTKSKPVDDEEELEAADDADEDADDIELEDDADDADDDGDDDEESVDEGPKSPPARITKTTAALIFLNWIAVPAFLIVAVLDYSARLQYSFRTTHNYTQEFGLPLEGEEDREAGHTPLYRETRPRLNITPEQLAAEFKKRPGAKSISEKFQAVDEPVPLRLRPSDMTPELLDAVFAGHPEEKVKTLEEEIRRLQKTVPTKIKQAADQVAEKLKGKSDAEKREVIHKTLVRIAWSAGQVEKLDKRIAAAKGAELDSLVDDAVQRRMYYDLLAPLNIYRPGDIKVYKIEKLADLNAYRIEDVQDFLGKRLNAALAEQHQLDEHYGADLLKETNANTLKRGSIEKRQVIAFILFALSQVSVPTLDERLYPKGIERAQIVSGLHEFTNASIQYVGALDLLRSRMVTAVVADRQGWLAKKSDGKVGQTKGFGAEYEEAVDRLVKLVEHIDIEVKRHADLTGQREHFQKIYDQRVKQHQDTVDKLLQARKGTEKYAQELRVLQEQLHAALVELSEAGDRNLRLYEQIRDIELGYLKLKNPKGGPKQP